MFEACFCRPYEGHDKGGVESRGKNIRLQSMVPVPAGVTLDDISATILADVERRFWARPDSNTRWTAEAGQLHALGARPFDPRKTDVSVTVSTRSLVTIEGATYSVPCSWARSAVTTHAGVSTVEIVNDRGESTVRRRLAKGQADIDYAAHYLDELSRKPQAVRQVADTLMEQLGAPFPTWWQDLIDESGPRDAARKMARILRGITELGHEECVRRVTNAFLKGEAIATALLVAVVPPCNETPLSLVPPALDIVVEASSVASFDALLLGHMDGAA